jgi:PhzF family phenazine biosynthesis protein
MTHILQVDAFSDRPFAGNPAAVCVLDQPADATWMQKIALEMNVAATAFVMPLAGSFRLRWFSPMVELSFCGHGTLAAAHALWQEGHVPMDEAIQFDTRSGLLIADRRGDLIELDLPSDPADEVSAPPNLIEALEVQPVFVGANRLDHLAVVDSEDTVRTLRPNLTLLAGVPTRGVIVTARSSSARYTFVSRYFAPSVGIYEDHVTGSAHCCLGPFWGARLGLTQMIGYQASPRGGTVFVRLGDGRVHLGGRAVTTLSCDLFDTKRDGARHVGA